MLVIDKQRILAGLEMDDEALLEQSACDVIYLRDQLVAVIRFDQRSVTDSILEFNRDNMLARLEGISCWVPVENV